MRSSYWTPYYYVAFKSPDRYGTYVFNMDSLARFVSTVVRVCRQAYEFGITIEDYVTKIEEFYDEKQKSDLKDWYNLQCDYFKEHCISDFLLLNANFYISTKNKMYENLEDWQRFYLELYMPNRFNVGDVIDYSWKDSFAYRELRGLHDKIFFDNTKRKKSNDYLLSHRDKFDNIITYNQEINNYVESEII